MSTAPPPSSPDPSSPELEAVPRTAWRYSEDSEQVREELVTGDAAELREALAGAGTAAFFAAVGMFLFLGLVALHRFGNQRRRLAERLERELEYRRELNERAPLGRELEAP